MLEFIVACRQYLSGLLLVPISDFLRLSNDQGLLNTMDILHDDSRWKMIGIPIAYCTLYGEWLFMNGLIRNPQILRSRGLWEFTQLARTAAND